MAIPPRILSLFSGIGGLDLGAKLATGGRVVCHVEGEAFAASVLVSHMQAGSLDQSPVWSDVRTFDGKPWRGAVDLICGGFPCQDISCAGRGEGLEGERSGLWWEFHRIIREVEPRYVFVENVGALLVRGLDAVLGSLAEIGFDAEWLSLRASDVGAPHRRERVFILAYRNEQGPQGRLECGGELQGRGERATRAGGSGMADTASKRRSTRLMPQSDVEHDGQEPSHGNQDMGEPARELLNGSGESGQGRRGQSPDASGIPLFPPGPSDDWSGIPDALKPAICGVPDEFPSRVDRLRACGNGVVPLQAAAAFTELFRRMTRDQKGKL